MCLVVGKSCAKLTDSGRFMLSQRGSDGFISGAYRLRGSFCKGIRSRKMLYVGHKSEKTSCTLVWLQGAASLKLSLTRFGSFILKLMRYAIHLVRRGQTVVIAHLIMRLQLLSIKRRFLGQPASDYSVKANCTWNALLLCQSREAHD